MANSSLLHFGETSGSRCRITLEPVHDLGTTAEVVSLLPRIAERREQASRAQAMRDITRYTFELYRVSKRTYSDTSNDHVFALLWGVKQVVNPDEAIDYLRPVEPLDVLNDPLARQAVGEVVHDASIDLIASSDESRPWVEHLGKLAQTEPSSYDTSA